jgi:glutathione S-transferase
VLKALRRLHRPRVPRRREDPLAQGLVEFSRLGIELVDVELHPGCAQPSARLAGFTRRQPRPAAPPAHEPHVEAQHCTRRCAYGVLFDQPSLLRELARRNVDRLQSVPFSLERISPLPRSAFSAALPLVIPAMRRALAVGEEQVDRSMEKVRRELSAISQRLADGRPYLVGTRFSAADLAFAYMAAPVLFHRSTAPGVALAASVESASFSADLRRTPVRGRFRSPRGTGRRSPLVRRLLRRWIEHANITAQRAVGADAPRETCAARRPPLAWPAARRTAPGRARTLSFSLRCSARGLSR